MDELEGITLATMSSASTEEGKTDTKLEVMEESQREGSEIEEDDEITIDSEQATKSIDDNEAHLPTTVITLDWDADPKAHLPTTVITLDWDADRKAHVQTTVYKLRLDQPETHDDADGKLHQIYKIFAEKVSPEFAIIVRKGAAKSKFLEEYLSYIAENKGILNKEEVFEHIVQLFYDKLDTEQTIKEEYIPLLRSIAMCEWKNYQIEKLAMYMFIALLDKTKKRGLSLVKDVLPPEVVNQLLLAAVGNLFRRFLSSFQPTIKCPEPDSFLSREECSTYLKFGAADLRSLHKGIDWLTMLAYSVDGVEDDVCSSISIFFPWREVFSALFYIVNKEYFDQNVMTKLKSRFFYIWRSTTSHEGRILTLQAIANLTEDGIEFAGYLDVIITTATFPLDYLHRPMKEKCLMTICPTSQLAVKLFQHYIRYADNDVDISLCLNIFAEDGVSDENVAAIVREIVAMKMMTLSIVDGVTKKFINRGLVQSVAELLQSGHTPTTHPFIDTLNKWSPGEPVSCKILIVCNPDLYNLNCTLCDNNALHLAADVGFTDVVKEILNRGFDKLLYKPSKPLEDLINRSHAVRPVTLAVYKAHYSTAIILLKAMEPAIARTLFKPSINTHTGRPEIDLHWVMREVKSGQGETLSGPVYRAKYSLDKKMVEKRVEFVETALNKTVIDGETIDLSVLIQDENGVEPEVFGGSAGHEETAGKEVGDTLYHKIAQSDFEELKNHESFATFTNIIWIDYGIVQGMVCFLYIIFIGFLTASLVLGAKSSDPSKYGDPIDGFRIFCEIITFLFLIKDLLFEANEIREIVARRSTHSTESNDKHRRCLRVTKEVIVEYYLNWQNILDNLSILFVFLIIPFRIADSDIQWIFAALAFLFNGLRIFKYAIMFNSIGEYVAILILLIKRDVPQFVTVFIVIIFSMGGALYLSLIGYYNDENIDAENNNETSEIYLLWGTGFRILAEGSVLTYTGPGGFNWLGVLIYWLFLFIVVVVMLNILIAQFGKSYEEETQKAQINVVRTRTEIIVKMDNSRIASAFVRLVRWTRNTLFKRNVDYSSMKRMETFIGEGEVDKPASSGQLLEVLQTQTTRLGLQLRNHMDNNKGKSKRGMEELKTEITETFKATELALKNEMDLKLTAVDNQLSEMDGKLVGLERVVVDTRRYVDEIHQMLSSMQDNR